MIHDPNNNGPETGKRYGLFRFVHAGDDDWELFDGDVILVRPVSAVYLDAVKVWDSNLIMADHIDIKVTAENGVLRVDAPWPDHWDKDKCQRDTIEAVLDHIDLDAVSMDHPARRDPYNDQMLCVVCEIDQNNRPVRFTSNDMSDHTPTISPALSTDTPHT